MALLDGKQLRAQSTSLDKLRGHSGLVTFTASATMSFGVGSTLRQANENILSSLDVVNKNYVDSVAQGLSVKASVHVISNTSSVVLSGTQSIDNVVVNVGERVLVNYQNSGLPDSSNGIYVVATGSWTRAEDSDGINIGSEVQLGNFVFVAYGQDCRGTGWVLSQTDSLDYDILVGTESQKWTQFSSAGTITAGDGLVQNGTDLDVNTSNGLVIISNSVQIDPQAAGNGLTFSAGVFNLNLAGSSGLTVSGTNFLSIDSGIGGNGLTFSGGVLDVIWGGTASGLTFSNGYAQVEVDNSTIQINASGQLTAVSGSSQPVYLTTTAVATTGNDSEVTGTVIGVTPNDFSRIQVFVNGQLQRLGNGNTLLDCYFGTTGSSTLLSNLQSGDQLYWNGTNAGFELSAIDKIDIIYES